jgi:hypothetical protein
VRVEGVKPVGLRRFNTVGFLPQGDRILISCIDVDRQLEGDLITGSWVVAQCSTLLLLLKILDAITLLPSPRTETIV